MIDFYTLVKNKEAFKTVKRDKINGNLSHAYLLLMPDEENLDKVLKVLVKLVLCNESEICGKCRACRLIDDNAYSDVLVFPEKKGAVLSSDVNKLIEESYFKPIEAERKIFVVSCAHTMNIQAQNKLLKTLEEPPENVHIFLGATSEFALLPTVKSRVKKLEIASFTNEELINALSSECLDKDRLIKAVRCGDGTVARALALYENEKLNALSALVLDVLENMRTSREVLKYSVKISESSKDLSDFFSVLELFLRDMLLHFSGKKELVVNTEILSSQVLNAGYNASSCVYALNKIEEAKERKKFNANSTMLLEWLLFQILEGKHKWQKL